MLGGCDFKYSIFRRTRVKGRPTFKMSKSEIKEIAQRDRLTAVPRLADAQPLPAISPICSSAGFFRTSASQIKNSLNQRLNLILESLSDYCSLIVNANSLDWISGRKLFRRRRQSKSGTPLRGPFAKISAELNIYANWIRRWHTFPVRDWIRAAMFFESGNFQLAADLYKRGLEKRPNHIAASHARFDYGYCLYRLGRLVEARTSLTETISANNRLRDAYLLLARIHLIFGHNRSALQTLKRCVELMPADISALTSYFHLLVSSGTDGSRMGLMRDELIQTKMRLQLDDFGQEQIDGCLAAYELKYGNRQRGERLLARVLASGRAPYDVILLRGELFLADGRIIQAREQFARAARIAPRDPRPFMFLANTYMTESPFQEIEWGLQNATAACRLSSYENAECLSALVRAYELNGESDVALLFIERMRDLPSTRQLNIDQMLSFKKELQRLRQMNA